MTYFNCQKGVLLFSLLFGFICASHSRAFAQLSITCPPDIVQSNDPGLCEAVVNYTPPNGTGTGSGLSTTLTQGFASGSSFPVGTTEVEYTVTNNEGNSASCSFFITVNDTEDPVFVCGPDITVNADAGSCSAVVFFDVPEVNDNCGVISAMQIGGFPSGSTFPLGESSIDFQAFDIEGNTAFCRIRIFVLDAIAPIITCPNDITVTIFNSCDSVITYTAPEGVDDCQTAETLLTMGLGSGESFSVGTTTETYTTTDISGNSASCSFNITVVDGAVPVIACPANVVANVDPGQCTAVVNFALATATDNCPGVSVSQSAGLPSGSAFPAGVSTVEFSATDASGNIATCTFTITITENENPTITCPGNILINTDPGECTSMLNYTVPIGMDNCPGFSTTLTSGLGSGGFFPIGTSTETYTVTDASGNTAVCNFDVIVSDNEAPTINCPADITVSNDLGLCTANISFTNPIATDNCIGMSGVQVLQTSGPNSGSDFPVGTTSVEFTATDNSGNTATCTFNIIVNDTENPTITCPADIVVSIPGGNCSGPVVYPDPVISDNCPGVTFSVVSGPTSGDELSSGAYTVMLQAIDGSGNSSDCSFQLNVSDTSTPIINCPANITVPTDDGVCVAMVIFEDPIASDSCSTVIVSQTAGPVSGASFPVGVTSVEFTATDPFGNSETCTINIDVIDQEAPEISCPGDIAASTAPGTCEAIINYPLPTATDNCGVLSINLLAGMASGSAFPAGTTIVSYEAVDASGNFDVCSFFIVVSDNENPTIACPADVTINIPNSACEATVNYPDPVVDDNCGIDEIQLLEGLASGASFPIGITTVSYQVSDISGNIAACSFMVSVFESQPPAIDCPANISVGNDAGLCGATVNYTSPEGIDACSNASTTFTSGLGSGAFFPLGTSTETYTVTDASGNESSCSFDIIVADIEMPAVMCPGDISVPAPIGSCEAIVNYALPTATDNCVNGLMATLVSGIASGSPFPVGTTAVIYEAADAAGNVANCSFNVSVIDGEAPSVICASDITVIALAGNCDAVVDYDLPVANDNCPGAGVTLIAGFPTGSTFPLGETILSFLGEDASGNTDTCSFSVVVLENDPPALVCPDNISVANDPGLCGAIVNYTPPVGIDNCGLANTVLIGGLAPGSFFPIGISSITFEATDLSGNVSNCSFDIEVIDTQMPAIACAGDTTISASQNCVALYDFDLPQVSDNCSENIQVVQTSGPPSGGQLPIGSTTLAFMATDEAGNSTNCSYSVTVVDDSAPIFTFCPADFSVNVGDSCSALVSFQVPIATDNCNFELVQSSGPFNNSVLGTGDYNVIFTATDDAGNSSNCIFTISVVDGLAPQISNCPESFETCSTTPEFVAPIATDNCSLIEIQTVQVQGSNSGEVFPIGSSTIAFEATDPSGNIATCFFTVEVLPTESANAGSDKGICETTSDTLSAFNTSVPGFWTQISGSGTIADPDMAITEVNGLAEGENAFVWTIDSVGPCQMSTDTVSIFVESDVHVDAGEDQLIFSFQQTVLFADVAPEGGMYNWQPANSLSCSDCPNPLANPNENTWYYLQYTTELGCTKTDSLFVTVFEKLTNTITPDGDGVNDVWKVPGIANYPQAQVAIYNRWGNTVFLSVGTYIAWDGSNYGKELPTGAYFYIIDFKTSGKDNLNGTVNIIR